MDGMHAIKEHNTLKTQRKENGVGLIMMMDEINMERNLVIFHVRRVNEKINLYRTHLLCVYMYKLCTHKSSMLVLMLFFYTIVYPTTI